MAKQKSPTDTVSTNEAGADVAASALVAADHQGSATTDETGAPGNGQPEAATQLVKARVLAHCAMGEPNDVIDIDAELAATMTDLVDTNAEAVTYALSISKE